MISHLNTWLLSGPDLKDRMNLKKWAIYHIVVTIIPIWYMDFSRTLGCSFASLLVSFGFRAPMVLPLSPKVARFSQGSLNLNSLDNMAPGVEPGLASWLAASKRSGHIRGCAAPHTSHQSLDKRSQVIPISQIAPSSLKQSLTGLVSVALAARWKL